MYESVVIGWDGTASSEEAAEWALRRLLGYRCTVLRVVDDAQAGRGSASPSGLEAEAARAVRAEVELLARRHPSARVTGEVTIGEAEHELERRTGPSSLLVLGSDRAPTEGARRPWAVSARIAARAHGPVVVVPLGCATRTGPVVVGVDGTEAARTAGLRAAELAAATWSALIVVHAWQAAGEQDEPTRSPIGTHDGVDAGRAEDDLPSRTLPAAHAQVLQTAVDAIRAAYPDLHIEGRLQHESPVVALAAAAEDASVLVLGRHSRWSSSALLLGSVTHGLLLTSPAPVLVVGRRDLPVVEVRPALADAPVVVGAGRQVLG